MPSASKTYTNGTAENIDVTLYWLEYIPPVVQVQFAFSFAAQRIAAYSSIP